MIRDQIMNVMDLHTDDYQFGIYNREDRTLEGGYSTWDYAHEISEEMNTHYPNDTYVVRIRIERVEI